MMNTLAQRYAQALFEYSRQQNVLDRVDSDLQGLNALAEQNPLLRNFFTSPVIPSEKRLSVIRELFEKKTGKETLNFLEFLIRKNRLDLIQEICRSFEQLSLEQRNVLSVKITTALKLDSGDLQTFKNLLMKKFNKEIEAEIHVEPALLGGLKIQAGDTIYDASLSTQLERFENKHR